MSLADVRKILAAAFLGQPRPLRQVVQTAEGAPLGDAGMIEKRMNR
jgi:hypothetical protein